MKLAGSKRESESEEEASWGRQQELIFRDFRRKWMRRAAYSRRDMGQAVVAVTRDHGPLD